ncbi:MAG: hypothetical protein AAF708_15550 [Deinococcota bacterium]
MDESELPLLAPFFQEELSISQAAQRLDKPIYFVYRRVQRWLALGLLQETKQVSRQGRPQRYFQTTAQTFFVPVDVVPIEYTTMREEKVRQERWVETLVMLGMRLSETKGIGWQVSASGGNFSYGPSWFGDDWDMLGSDDPVLLDCFETLHLTAADAKALQRELAGLIQRYQGREQSGQRAYLVRLGVLARDDGNVVPYVILSNAQYKNL